MGKGIFNDSMSSISQCNMYSNPYDTRMQANPALIKRRQDNFIRAQDTLASSQSKMEKDIFLKLQAENFKLPKGSFLIVGQLAKYAFLAIMLPPYIFCYGIPKWVLAEGMPRIYNFTAHLVRRITDKVSGVAHKCVDALKSLGRKITSPILTYIQTRVEKTRELFAQIRGSTLALLGYPFRVVNQNIIQPINNLYARIQEELNKIAMAYRNLSEKLSSIRQDIRHFFIYLPNNIEDKFVEFYRMLQNRLNQLMESIQPILGWAKMCSDKVSSFYDQAVEAIKQRLKSVIDRVVLPPIQIAKDLAKAARNKAKEAFEAITRPIIDWIDPKLEALKKAWNDTKDRFNEFVEKRKEKAKEIWKGITDRVDSGVKNLGKTVIDVANQVVQFIPQPIISLFTPVAAFIASPFDYRKTKGVLNSFIKKVKEKVHSGMQNAAKWLAKAKEAGRKAVKRIVKKLRTVPMKLLNLLKKILLFIITALKGSFLILRLMVAWMKALFRYGMLLVREMTRSLLSSSHT